MLFSNVIIRIISNQQFTYNEANDVTKTTTFVRFYAGLYA